MFGWTLKCIRSHDDKSTAGTRGLLSSAFANARLVVHQCAVNARRVVSPAQKCALVLGVKILKTTVTSSVHQTMRIRRRTVKRVQILVFVFSSYVNWKNYALLLLVFDCMIRC